jgi:hypothetical protein
MKSTDWNSYYSKPYKTATYSRKITAKRLVKVFLKIREKLQRPISVAEWGGANSCFFETIKKEVSPVSYSILDNNPLGLDFFRKRIGTAFGTVVEADVLNFQGTEQFDLVYSVGLIEHFAPKDTWKSVEAHWSLVKRGGYMVLFFPTPTWLYRIVRQFAEWLGLWIFHDERPIKPEEIIRQLPLNAVLEDQFIIWPIFLTQAGLVIRKQ